MEREQIVKEFFTRGHILTEDALKIIEEKGVESFAGLNLPPVVRQSDLFLPYKILKNLDARKEEITKEDFVKFYNSKYDRMRDIIVSRIQKDFLSLNKIDGSRSEIHVLGIVREIKEKDGKKVIELEDKTATVPVILEDLEDIELDDVIAVRAISGGKVLFGKKIIYPDIPLRNPAIGSGKACFVSDLRLNEAPSSEIERFFIWFSNNDVPYLFIAGGIGNAAELEKYVDRYCYRKTVFVISDGEYPSPPEKYNSRRIVALSNPAIIELGGLKILITSKADTTMLKKRYLGRSRVILDEDYLALDVVPDIVHSGGDVPLIANYKATTIVSSGSLMGEFKPIIIDFATREAEKINIETAGQAN
jgi:DNA polymerase II small subunit/DNA polymerase delta subunit B